MFVDVCFNFAPFLSQVTTFLFIDGQDKRFPGIWTTYGGAILFVGCTLLAMNYKDHKELAQVPLIGRVERQNVLEDIVEQVPMQSQEMQ